MRWYPRTTGLPVMDMTLCRSKKHILALVLAFGMVSCDQLDERWRSPSLSTGEGGENPAASTLSPIQTPPPHPQDALAEPHQPTIDRRPGIPTSTLQATSIARPSPPSSDGAEVVGDVQGWQKMPIVPNVSDRVIAIYQEGLNQGNNPQAFSKIGDGEISTTWFLADFDRSSGYYDLGSHDELQDVIDYFAGSFGRHSQAAHLGFNTSRILDSAYSDEASCQPDETPLDCEFRIHRPSFALLSLGTN